MILVGRSYVDNVVVTAPISLDPVDNTSSDLLDTFHVYSSCSLPSPSPECHNMSLVNYHNVLEGNLDDCVEFIDSFRGMTPPSIHIAYT